MTLLPATVKPELTRHLERVRRRHREDLERGAGWVEIPYGLARKYPTAGRDWGWQWVFPATRTYMDRVSGSDAGITCTSRSCSARSRKPYEGRG